VAAPRTNWTPGQFLNGEPNTNKTDFSPVPITNAQAFFFGQQGNQIIFINYVQDAYESNSVLGIPSRVGIVEFDEFVFTSNTLDVYYTLSGTARNGIDFTNLSGVATIPGNQGSVQVAVQPIDVSTLTNPIESVVFTTQPNTNYLVAPDQNSASLLIKSSSTTVSVSSGGDATRPGPGRPEQDGLINFIRYDDLNRIDSALTVNYQLSGTASNGVDYQLLSGSVTFAAGAGYTNVTIVPLAESVAQGTKDVIFTLSSTNGYLVAPTSYSATSSIYELLDTVDIYTSEPAINSNGPPGEPPQIGAFDLFRASPDNLLPGETVYYQMSGQTSNGVDYAMLAGSVTVPDGSNYVSVFIQPISNWTNMFKTVTMTLLPGYYQTDPGAGVRTTAISNSSTEISVVSQQDAVLPQGTNAATLGIFNVRRTDGRGYSPTLAVRYSLSGTATNGQDYTNLSGVITFAPGASQTNIYIQLLTNNQSFWGDKSVIISLIPATNYFVNPDASTASLSILDNNILFQTVISGLGGVTGLEYDPFLTNLIFSVVGGRNGADFWRLGTNITVTGGNTVTNLVLASWSGINGLSDEVYMSVVTNNVSGFTNGDMFFGSDTGIGWLSSNAAMSNFSWCVLTNATQTNALLLRGSICMDTTGAFSNNIIAVTSDFNSGNGIPRGVWEVDSHGHPTLLTNISAQVLEGVVVTRTNFGPWSQKIITGDEFTGLLYTIDTNGALATIDSKTLSPDGIYSESIQMIPTNQDLYLCDDSAGSIVKLSKNYFTNYVGDLLIEGGGENLNLPAKLFIIHWDAASASYITHRIRYTFSGDSLEHCVFAPIEFPAH